MISAYLHVQHLGVQCSPQSPLSFEPRFPFFRFFSGNFSQTLVAFVFFLSTVKYKQKGREICASGVVSNTCIAIVSGMYRMYRITVVRWRTLNTFRCTNNPCLHNGILRCLLRTVNSRNVQHELQHRILISIPRQYKKTDGNPRKKKYVHLLPFCAYVLLI